MAHPDIAEFLPRPLSFMMTGGKNQAKGIIDLLSRSDQAQ